MKKNGAACMCAHVIQAILKIDIRNVKMALTVFIPRGARIIQIVNSAEKVS